MKDEKVDSKWYALRVRSRHEDAVAKHLDARGLESFLPLYKSQRRWSDRFKEIEVPLFPGYVFCHFNVMNRLPILTIPGVVHVVGVGKIPAPIDESEIAAIQVAAKSGLPSEPWPSLCIGHKVRIEHGPLLGIQGILSGFRGHRRLVLSVTLLQRSIAVQVDEAWVQPIALQHRACSAPVTAEGISIQPVG